VAALTRSATPLLPIVLSARVIKSATEAVDTAKAAVVTSMVATAAAAADVAAAADYIGEVVAGNELSTASKKAKVASSRDVAVAVDAKKKKEEEDLEEAEKKEKKRKMQKEQKEQAAKLVALHRKLEAKLRSAEATSEVVKHELACVRVLMASGWRGGGGGACEGAPRRRKNGWGATALRLQAITVLLPTPPPPHSFSSHSCVSYRESAFALLLASFLEQAVACGLLHLLLAIADTANDDNNDDDDDDNDEVSLLQLADNKEEDAEDNDEDACDEEHERSAALAHALALLSLLETHVRDCEEAARSTPVEPMIGGGGGEGAPSRTGDSDGGGGGGRMGAYNATQRASSLLAASPGWARHRGQRYDLMLVNNSSADSGSGRF